MITLAPLATHLADLMALVFALCLFIGIGELRRRFLRWVGRIKARTRR